MQRNVIPSGSEESGREAGTVPGPRFLATLAMTVVLLLFTAASPRAADAAQPVIVELFTSQGCSSCPPADALLSELAHNRNIIPLAFHVDYWDHHGWRDPFSSPQWSARQVAYVQAMSLASAYTPQAVVNGEWQMVGSDRRALNDAIARASQEKLDAHVALDRGVARGSTSRELDLFAVVVQNSETTAVKSGENGGRTLRNEAIVRELKRIARVNGRFEQAAGAANVVFLQDPKTLRIYAAATR